MEGRAIRVDLPDGSFRRVPLNLLGSVVIHGAALVRSDVLTALAERGVPVVIRPGRGRGPSAFSGAGLAPFAHWREAQYAVYLDREKRLAMTRQVLLRKLRAYAEAARALPVNPDRAQARIHQALDRLDAAMEANGLRGVEGAAQAGWFESLRECIDAPWGFEARNRRPPRDPVNALLSLGYTLLQGAVGREVEQQGLDPATGFLHVPAPNRPALCLDAMEPLRPWIDLWVIETLSDLDPSDFHSSQTEGCRLGKTARGRFYARWERFAASGWPAGLVGPEITPTTGQGDGEDDAPGVVRTATHSLAANARQAVAWLRHDLSRIRETP